jgi:hypothetical protein
VHKNTVPLQHKHQRQIIKNDMKKELTLTQPAAGTAGMYALIHKMAFIVRRPADALRRHYSDILGEQLTMRQTALIVNAQAAFILAVFPVSCPLLFRLACGAWLVSALLKCKNSGIRTSD